MVNAMMLDKTEPNDIFLDAISPYSFTPLIIEMINFILKGVGEGLILINKGGEIEFIDKYTEKYFNLKPGEGKGVHITELIPESRLHLVAKTGVKEVGKVLKVKGENIIVTRFPIKKGDHVIGAIGKIIFHKLDQIENLNNEISALKLKINRYKKGLEELISSQYTFDDIIGSSGKLLAAKNFAKKVSVTNNDILIIGESGTGKELFAHSIHNMSPRRNRPFVRINCASIPFELAESELFGYEKGAFSGARMDGKPGKFELGEGGSIFLDDVESLPLNIQAKLLRVLQEREIERLGARSPIKINFRLIAATNIKLTELMEKGHFRSDLFYRLSSLQIYLPPLRERKEDIPTYVNHYLAEINKSLKSQVSGLSDESLKIIMNYRWPGNVRELINVLKQSTFNVIRGDKILPENLPEFLLKKGFGFDESNFCLRNVIEKVESEAIRKVLNLTKGNKRKAAELLGIQRSILYQKLNKYQINSDGGS